MILAASCIVTWSIKG